MQRLRPARHLARDSDLLLLSGLLFPVGSELLVGADVVSLEKILLDPSVTSGEISVLHWVEIYETLLASWNVQDLVDSTQDFGLGHRVEDLLGKREHRGEKDVLHPSEK